MERNQKDEVRALQDTIYVIGGKWKLPIINSICNGNNRFREIERSISGLSTRMLSRELKELEMNGLIRRIEDADSGMKVKYQSTAYCKSLSAVILSMIDWGKKHRKKIVASMAENES